MKPMTAFPSVRGGLTGDENVAKNFSRQPVDKPVARDIIRDPRRGEVSEIEPSRRRTGLTNANAVSDCRRFSGSASFPVCSLTSE